MSGVLFLCVANSARSQLAEAIARDLLNKQQLGVSEPQDVTVCSAGSHPTHVRPQVHDVLREVDIDTYGLRSKGMLEIPLEDVDTVVTLCMEEQCPILPPGVTHISWPLPDPAAAPPDEAHEAFRATRDELLRRLPPFLKERFGAPQKGSDAS